MAAFFNALVVMVMSFMAIPSQVTAEVSAPSVHWGGLGFPDKADTAAVGFVVNYFSMFGDPGRYNQIGQSMGFNFGTMTYTKFVPEWRGFKDWSVNLTLGAGPTDPEPSKTIQNWMHDVIKDAHIPTGPVRQATDMMFDGSLTKWIALGTMERVAFVGGGVSVGTLYYEEFLRAGLRNIPAVTVDTTYGVMQWSFSAMGRYGHVSSSSAFHSGEVANNTVMAQGSTAIGWYDEFQRPNCELELGLTIDSGLFVDLNGHHKEEHFGYVGLRFPYVSIAMWNDSWAPPKWFTKDNGPTGGGYAMLDLLRIMEAVSK